MVLEMAILRSQSRLPLITFLEPYLIIGTGEIQLCELFGLTQPIQRLSNKGKGVPVLDGEVIESSIINTKSKASIRFLVE